MNLSFGSIIAGLVFGAFGLYFIKEGRRRVNFYWLVIGLVMLVFTYFVQQTWLQWGIGIGLFALAYNFRDSA